MLRTATRQFRGSVIDEGWKANGGDLSTTERVRGVVNTLRAYREAKDG